jgi:hypothetical protein
VSPHLLQALLAIQWDMRNTPDAFTSRTPYEWFVKNPVAKDLYREGII